jgi:nickel-dependent lactate racemase
MTAIDIPYGAGTLTVTIPEKNLAGTLFPREPSETGNEEQLIRNALQNPAGSRRITEIVGPDTRIALIVSDITRPVPTARLLPPLLEEITQAGGKKENITVVFALGLHRNQTGKEMEKIMGTGLFGKLRCVEHDPERCIPLGTTSFGTPVEVFEEVMNSDVIIGTGNVEYHYYAGYSGGGKCILPGVSSRNSVITNHKMMTLDEATAGNIASPVRRDMEEAAGIAGLDFIANVVLNSRGEVVCAVAGDYIKAHRQAMECVDRMYKVPVEPADAVIVGTDVSKGMNLYQAYKPLDNAKNAVKEGGAILLAAPSPEGFGHEKFECWCRECACPDEVIDRFENNFEFGAHKAAFIARLAKKHKLFIKSGMSDRDVRDAFFEPVEDVQEFVDGLLEEDPDARICVMPHGQMTLPVHN